MEPADKPFPKGCVLVVEDEDVLRMTFEEFLTEDGYTVYACPSYNAALDVLENHSIDVVVSDIILGGNTGMDLLKAIHEREWPCKVIMITGDPSLQTASEAVRLAAFDYLAKPVNGTALLRVVRQAMERRNIEDERDRYRSELDAIFHSVRAGVITVNPEMQIKQANLAARDMLELPEDFEGVPIASLPMIPEEISQALQRAARDGQMATELRVDTQNTAGQRRVYMLNTAPLALARQRRAGPVAALRDVTRLMYLEAQIGETKSAHDIVGRSAKMQEIYRFIDDLAETDATVLVHGESGTGKELVAAAIHRSGRRAARPLIKVNCAA